MGENPSGTRVKAAARKVLAVLLFVAVFVSLPSQLAILVEDPGSFPDLEGRPTSAEVREAMRYHGAEFAYTDGQTWFFRDRRGNECPLFTKAFRSTITGKGRSS